MCQVNIILQLESTSGWFFFVNRKIKSPIVLQKFWTTGMGIGTTGTVGDGDKLFSPCSSLNSIRCAAGRPVVLYCSIPFRFKASCPGLESRYTHRCFAIVVQQSPCKSTVAIAYSRKKCCFFYCSILCVLILISFSFGTASTSLFTAWFRLTAA